MINNIKLFILLMVILYIINVNIYIKNENINFNDNYYNIQKDYNLSFKNKIKRKINIGIFAIGLKNGGRARITSQLIKYLIKIKIFNIILFTQKNKEDNEYINKEITKRILINNYNIYNLIKENKKRKIDILIYQLSNFTEIEFLNNIKNMKIIYYLHQSILYWVYFNYSFFKSLYKAYQNSKYIISLVPFENNYLFKKWGISSILMDNFVTFDYNCIISSSLSSKIILMIGRGADKYKRFQHGIQSMEYIIEDISKCEMRIISELEFIYTLKEFVSNLNLNNVINFLGYSLILDVHLKNASLHFFPTLSESFGLVLSETKIYGIPNILLGLDYVTIAKKGTIIIYDDTPESIAKASLKILKNDKFKKHLGNDARKSMKIFSNKLLLQNWIKLFLSIYCGDIYYDNLRLKKGKKLIEYNMITLLKNQIKLLKTRNAFFNNITISNIGNFSFLEQLN